MKKIFTFALCIAFALCLTGCGSNNASTTTNQSNSVSSEVATSNTPNQETVHYAGLYYVGQDIPAGRYIFTRDANETFLMIDIWDDYSTNDANEAIFHEWFEGEKTSVSVLDGQVLEVQNGTFVAA